VQRINKRIKQLQAASYKLQDLPKAACCYSPLSGQFSAGKQNQQRRNEISRSGRNDRRVRRVKPQLVTNDKDSQFNS
jgi:hypothetical protein